MFSMLKKRFGGRYAAARKRLAASRAVNPHFSPGEGKHHTGLTPAERAEATARLKAASKSRHENFVNKAGALVEALDSIFPTTFHSISVHVKGGPSADLRRIWFLAVSACMGRLKDHGIASVRGSTLNGEWDISGKECTMQFAYTVTGVAGYIGAQSGNVGNRPRSGQQLLQRGPDQVTVGGAWVDISVLGQFSLESQILREATAGSISGPSPFVLERPDAYVARTPINGGAASTAFTLRETPSERAGGFGASIRSIGPAGAGDYRVSMPTGSAPYLMDKNRIITTGEKKNHFIQGPKPPVDGISRVSNLDMIVASLTSPGFSVVAPIQTDIFVQPLACSGVFKTGADGSPQFGDGRRTVDPTTDGPSPDITGS